VFTKAGKSKEGWLRATTGGRNMFVEFMETTSASSSRRDRRGQHAVGQRLSARRVDVAEVRDFLRPHVCRGFPGARYSSEITSECRAAVRLRAELSVSAYRGAPRFRRGGPSVWGTGGHFVAPELSMAAYRGAHGSAGAARACGGLGPFRGPS